MSLTLLSPPAIEPVTLAEAKAHLRIDTGAEDVMLQSLILTSRLHIEAAIGLALVTQAWQLVIDRWPRSGMIELPMRPVQAVLEVRVRAADGTASMVDAASYVLDGKGLPPRLVATRSTWPAPGRAAGGIEIDFTAGFGPLAADVPEPIRHALLLLVAHWYEHRDPLEMGTTATNIPAAVSDLLMAYRTPRL